MITKLTGAAVAAVMTMAMLTACGGDDSSSSASYCDDVRDAVAQVKSLEDPTKMTTEKFNSVQESVHNIAGEAPDDIKDSWTTLEGALNDLEQAMSDAGLTMDQFGQLTSGDIPEGVTTADLQQLQSKLSSLGSAELDKADDKIKTEAKSECNVDIDS